MFMSVLKGLKCEKERVELLCVRVYLVFYGGNIQNEVLFWILLPLLNACQQLFWI